MGKINKVSVLEAFTRLNQLSWLDLTEIFLGSESNYHQKLELSYIIKQLEDEGLIAPISNGKMKWIAKPTAYDRFCEWTEKAKPLQKAQEEKVKTRIIPENR